MVGLDENWKPMVPPIPKGPIKLYEKNIDLDKNNPGDEVGIEATLEDGEVRLGFWIRHPLIKKYGSGIAAIILMAIGLGTVLYVW